MKLHWSRLTLGLVEERWRDFENLPSAEANELIDWLEEATR